MAQPKAEGVVVDACVMREFSNQMAVGEGETYDVVTQIARGPGIALEEGEVMEKEWTRHGSDYLLAKWVQAEFDAHRLRYVQGKYDPGAKHRLRQLGFPASRDYRYIWCANATRTRYLLTEDMDYYEPAEKRAGSARRKDILETRCGGVCRYLQEKLDIVVGPTCHVLQYLDGRRPAVVPDP